MSRRDAFAAGHGRPEFHADPFSFTPEQLDRFLISRNDALAFNGGPVVNRALEGNDPRSHVGGPSMAVTKPLSRVSMTGMTRSLPYDFHDFPAESLAKLVSIDPDRENHQREEWVDAANEVFSKTRAHDSLSVKDLPWGEDRRNQSHADLISSMAAEGKYAGILRFPDLDQYESVKGNFRELSNAMDYASTVYPVVDLRASDNPDDQDWAARSSDAHESRSAADRISEWSGRDETAASRRWERSDPHLVPHVVDLQSGTISPLSWTTKALGDRWGSTSSFAPGVDLRGHIQMRSPRQMKHIWDTISRAQIGNALQGRVR